MREQLIQYVDLLFAGAQDSQDMKQEILQNTLDRYDDLIAEGKVPQAAYRLAIAGIGDIQEILGKAETTTSTVSPASEPAFTEAGDTPAKKLFRAIAIGLYILCPLPLIVLGDLGMEMIGLCGTITIVAIATVLMILGGKKETKEPVKTQVLTPRQELYQTVQKVIRTVGFILYFVVSFATDAWFFTWIIFPITGAVWGLAKAILDLKGEAEYEN